ncbi:acetyl-CoA carboxylase biotin carboxyl carrier protein subunit [Cupriavidus necator]|uniref:acetyl-CoA carboxylase biotin carboxyl carrier protein subunit n=1 Tax=Cupriavidus necator TaxID=106590 RepID=UPI00339D336A
MPDQSNALPIVAETTGTLWKIVAAPNVAQARDATLVIIESMKMEIPVEAPADGYVAEYLVGEGEPVEEGQVLGAFILAG